MATGRNFGRRQFFHAKAFDLDSEEEGEERGTIPLPEEVEMFQIEIYGIAEGASLLYRNVRELQAGGADTGDVGALAEGFCAKLDASRTSTGWIPAQPSAVRIEAVGGALTATIVWTASNRPQVSA